MNKILALLAALFLVSLPIHAEQYVAGPFNDTADGTRSATAFVPAGQGLAHVTDLTWDLDATVTTGTVDIRRGEAEFAVSSATSASGTAIWFDNDPTFVSAYEYVIFYDSSLKTYSLFRCVTSAATSITVQETIGVATTTSDKLYSCLSTIRRHAPNVTSSTWSPADIWLPSDLPSALTVDGNTTSCRISVSGTRIRN
jgi:hypothetical protein